MKNKKILALLAVTVVASTAMTACGLGGDEPEQMVVEATPTPKPTQAPTPTPAPANSQSTTYNSKDKQVSISLPDATWANKTDTDSMLSFESPDQGKILILHGEGDDAMAAAVIPDSQDIAVALEQAADLEEGTDFNILDYSAENIDGINVYSYTVEYLNEKSGYAYVVNKYFANDSEFYSIAGSVKTVKNTPKLLKRMKNSVNSFTIKGDSALKSAAAEKTQEDAAGAEGTENTGDAAADSQGESSGNTGAGNVSDAALSDTSQTRTIYDNDDGSPLVIYADGNGGWSDEYGNTYEFHTDEDVYNQDGKDYYYHGEAADVYYMPVE